MSMVDPLITHSAEPPEEDYEELELSLAKLLRTGVNVSALFTGAGLVWFLVTRKVNSPQVLDLTRPHADAVPHTLAQLYSGVMSGQPLALCGLGLLLLVLTPVLRVAISIVLFLLQRDYLYTVICTFVLGILIFGMLLGSGAAG